jgi:hypothetical protein
MVLAMVTVAVAVAMVLASGTAVMVTVGDPGTTGGAVYRPLELMVPMEVSPPMMLFTCQLTPLLPPPPWTEAVNCCVWPGGTVAVVGEMEMEAPPPPHAAKSASAHSAAASRKYFINFDTPLTG